MHLPVRHGPNSRSALSVSFAICIHDKLLERGNTGYTTCIGALLLGRSHLDTASTVSFRHRHIKVLVATGTLLEDSRRYLIHSQLPVCQLPDVQGLRGSISWHLLLHSLPLGTHIALFYRIPTEACRLRMLLRRR